MERTSKSFIFIASYAWPFLTPPTSVHPTPSRLMSACTLSIVLLVESPAFQISIGMRLFSQHKAGKANLLRILSCTQSKHHWTYFHWTCFTTWRIRTSASLSPFSSNPFNSAIPIRMPKTQQWSHELANIIIDIAFLNISLRVHIADTNKTLEVVIRTKRGERLMGFM